MSRVSAPSVSRPTGTGRARARPLLTWPRLGPTTETSVVNSRALDEARSAARRVAYQPALDIAIAGQPPRAADARKDAGAYYTPDAVVATLLHWAVRNPTDRLLDPSCGDGGFIARHHTSVGIEQDPDALARAAARAPWATVFEGDFFTWAACTRERFECAAGNPPFIRYHRFSGAMRERAQRLCSGLGADFSGLSSSWAPFLVATASLLKPGGRMAFLVPAEIGHAPYAAPLIEYLAGHFERVHIIAVRTRLFPDLSEDCWLLYTEGFGGRTGEIHFSSVDRMEPRSDRPTAERLSIGEWRGSWNRRLRPLLVEPAARELYQAAAAHEEAYRFGEIARIGIGYVSGANDFFHLRPSEAVRWGIPDCCLHPSIRNGRSLPPLRLTRAYVERWLENDEPVMLLRLPRRGTLPAGVRRYLDTDAARLARQTYKCRMRDPWYSVPDVQVPDLFLSYMSGVEPSLVVNDAGCTCTNSVHSVRMRDQALVAALVDAWNTPFVRLSCEIEGHPLGGGLLKLEPREAARILFPPPALSSAQESAPEIRRAVATMRAWRHYAAAAADA